MEPLPCPEAHVLLVALPPSHSRVSGGTARRAQPGGRGEDEGASCPVCSLELWKRNAVMADTLNPRPKTG